jgi:hypothetical protein
MPEDAPHEFVVTRVFPKEYHGRNVPEQMRVNINPEFLADPCTNPFAKLLASHRGGTVSLRKQEGRRPRAEQASTLLDVCVDPITKTAGQLKALDFAVLRSGLGQLQEDASIAGLEKIPFWMQLGEIFAPDRTVDQKLNRNGFLSN